MNINIYAFPVCDCAHDGDGMCAEDEVCKHCYCLPKGIKIFRCEASLKVGMSYVTNSSKIF